MPSRTYERWIADFDTWSAPEATVWRRRIRALLRKPVVSILLPVYNPELKFLEAAVESVRNQVYDAWELCIADDASTDPRVRPFLEEIARDDARVRLTIRKTNGHIAACSNSALELARGEWCALLDQDDLLAERAFAAVAFEIADHPEAGIIYSDEDKIDADGTRSEPFFKGDWNHELFLGQNFINHLGVYRASLVREVGGFREGFEGSQDYDLALRCIERLRADQVRHIPGILYHWRRAEGSVAADPKAKPYATEAARRAIAEHLQRRGIAARVEACPEAIESHRVIYELPEPRPLVSIIVPFRDQVEVLEQCIRSLGERTDYAPIEIIGVDNGSVEARTHEFLRGLESQLDARVLEDPGDFNFSRLINRAAAVARGQLLALLNNDIEAENSEWLREMVAYAVQPGVGAVGARLWYPKGGLQHGGVILGLGGVAGHALYRARRGETKYFNRALLQQNCSAVTAACMVVRKELFETVGGFDEINLPISFNDVDFCLRVRALGLQNVWTPYANLTHYESVSRGHHTAPEEQEHIIRESIFMQEKWGPELLEDPFYNSNLTLNWPGFDLAFPPRLDNRETLARPDWGRAGTRDRAN